MSQTIDRATPIPDDKLEEYLKGKLTVKPNYGFDTQVKSEIQSRWEQAQKAMREDRNKRNRNFR